MEHTVAARLDALKRRMRQACLNAGRSPDEVRLLLATKTVSPDRLREALVAGETLFGENKAQELRDKYASLQPSAAEWHFIGHLQTNKVKDVVRYAACIHSVDRIKLGEALHERLSRTKKTMDILVQVNTSEEESKFGVAPDEAESLIRGLAELDTLRIKGLMTIGKLGGDETETRSCFRLLKQLQDHLAGCRIPGVELRELSMGMSGDFELAIAEGATIIRVGTSIFGERGLPDSYYWNEHGPSRDSIGG